MKEIFNALNQDIVNYFDGTNGKVKIENSLIYNSQDDNLNEQIQYLYPLCYISFPIENDWLQLGHRIMWCPFEFDVRLEIENYDLPGSTNLSIDDIFYKLVNRIHKLTLFNDNFILREFQLINESSSEQNNNIVTKVGTFSVNSINLTMTDEYMKEGTFNEVCVKGVVIKANNYGSIIKYIDGGDTAENGVTPEIVGVAPNDYTTVHDYNNIDGGWGATVSSEDMTLDEGWLGDGNSAL